MAITGGIDHLMRDVVLVLSITFVVPLIGAVAGTIAANLSTFQGYRKGKGRQNG